MRTADPDIEFAEPWEAPKRRHKHHDHRVTQLRHEHELSQEGMAEVWGISRDLLAQVEAGRRSLPFTLEEGRAKLEAVAEQREADKALVRRILRRAP